MTLISTIVVERFFSIFSLQKKLCLRMQISLYHLQALSREIFSSLTTNEYAEHLYLFERRIHIQKKKFLQSLLPLQNIVITIDDSKNARYPKQNEIKLLINKINLLYDILIDCSLLRFRVKDHATFKICEQELIAISQAIDQVLGDLIRSFRTRKQVNVFHIADLMQRIQSLEETYQQVLQVAANDPLVFFLFIYSLNSLVAELEVFHETVKLYFTISNG